MEVEKTNSGTYMYARGNEREDPSPDNCSKCHPLLTRRVPYNQTIQHQSTDELADRLGRMLDYSKARNRHLDHKLLELERDKDNLAKKVEKLTEEIEGAHEETEEYGARLQEFGLHPDQRARVAMQHNQMDELDMEGWELSSEDIASINNVGIKLCIRGFDRTLVRGNLKMGFPVIKRVPFLVEEVKSMYTLSLDVLQQADAQKHDMSILITIEMLPRLTARPYYRVLHGYQYQAWLKGMTILKQGPVEMVAYLWRTKDAEDAVKRLEREAAILKY
jgi:hypothetical protein